MCISSFVHYVAPGIPYQVTVVAFTNAGMGELDDYLVFFTQELSPLHQKTDFNIKQLNSTSINVTWTPLSLFDAQGFPQYHVVLTPNSCSEDQSLVIVTNNSFVVLTNVETSKYSINLGVATAASKISSNHGSRYTGIV